MNNAFPPSISGICGSMSLSNLCIRKAAFHIHQHNEPNPDLCENGARPETCCPAMDSFDHFTFKVSSFLNLPLGLNLPIISKNEIPLTDNLWDQPPLKQHYIFLGPHHEIRKSRVNNIMVIAAYVYANTPCFMFAGVWSQAVSQAVTSRLHSYQQLS